MAFEDRLTDTIDIFRMQAVDNGVGGYTVPTPSSALTSGLQLATQLPCFFSGKSDSEIVDAQGNVSIATDTVMLDWNTTIKNGDYIFRYESDGVTRNPVPYLVLRIRKAPDRHHMTLECQYQDDVTTNN